jgi:hypothetical protein
VPAVGQLWKPKEKRVLKRFYGVLTYKQLTALLSRRTWYAIRNQANYLGLTHGSNLGRKYSANKKFFSHPNILNSYWAGFIAADGNVKRNRLQIKLSSKDAEHLERFRLDISYTGSVKRFEKVAYLGINCKKMVNDLLKNFNIVERKSLVLKPPTLLSGVKVKAFIRGLIDGNGSITFKRTGKHIYPRIIIYGTRAICRWIRERFDKWSLPTNYRRAVERKIKGEQLHAYAVSGSRAEKIGEVLLRVDVPELSRKWDRLR